MSSATRQAPGRWAMMTVAVMAGCAAFLVLAGEDNPEAPMSLTRFLIIKLAALAVLAVCAKAVLKISGAGRDPGKSDTEETSKARIKD